MRNNWILDVLTDLRFYASEHGLSDLAEHLDDARQIASAEMATMGQEVRAGVNGQTRSGSDSPGFGRHQRA